MFIMGQYRLFGLCYAMDGGYNTIFLYSWQWIVCVAVPPHFTSQDCSVCGTRVQKTLSTRTHQCPNCKTILDRDHNAAINILKKGLKYLGNYLNGTVGQTETDPNALGESDLWIFSGDIENLSCLVEQGISDSDMERIPRHSVA